MTTPSPVAGPFTLGTVQLGLTYGLGEIQPSQIAGASAGILDAAAAAGIVWLDTARSYGQSEVAIGEWQAARGKPFRIVTKIPSLESVADEDAAQHTKAALALSLKTLRVSSADICLVHRAADLARPAVADVLRAAKIRGSVKSFGASAYWPHEIESLLDIEGLGALQIPLSVVSQGFRESDVLARAAARGIVVFVRSVFLQGALLMPAERLPPHLRSLAPVVRRLNDLARDAGVDLPALLIAAARGVPGVASLVLGVDSVAQLQGLLRAAATPVPQDVIEAAFQAGRGQSDAVIDPRQWPKAATQ